MPHPLLEAERQGVLKITRQLADSEGWVELSVLDDESPFEAGVSRMTLDGLVADGLMERQNGSVRVL